MTPDEALAAFLRGSLGTKRDRTIDFATRPKTRPKFLDLLYHQLGGLFRPACAVGQLPDTAWALPAYRFSPPHEFGASVPTLRAAHDVDGHSELVITTDGRYGYWRDEMYADAETLIVANARI